MKKAFMKIRYMCFVLLICLGLIPACNETARENNKENENSVSESMTQIENELSEPLRVFYTEAGLLSNFIYLYPDVKLELHRISPNYEGEQVDIAYWAKEYGDPDIILLNDWSGFDLEKEYANGQIQDMTEFYFEDESVSESEYVPGTFEVLNTKEALLGVPLSWYKSCLIVRESCLQNSELASLSENYTGYMLFETLLSELKKDDYREKFAWINWPTLLMNLGEMGELAQNEEGTYTIDEDLFQLLYEFAVRSSYNYYEIKASYADFRVFRKEYQGQPALDPEIYGGDYFGSFLFSSPQSTAIYAKSVAAENQDDVQLYWIPTADSTDEYIGYVMDFALIGKNSARKQQAYEVIRMMMDMPVEIMTQPMGEQFEIYSSINIERSLEMLEYFDEFDQELQIQNGVGTVFGKVQQERLSNNEKEKIGQVIKGMKGLYLDISRKKESMLLPIYADYEVYCLEGGEIDYKSCYYEFMHLLNPEEPKWNLSGEKLDAYLKGEEEEMVDPIANEEMIQNVEIGDTILLGEIEQDNNLENGAEKIEWVVLKKVEDKAFVISKNVLEYLPVCSWTSNIKIDNVPSKAEKSFFTWQEKRNHQREWLKQLYEVGFSESEKEIIQLTKNNTYCWYDEILKSEDYLFIPTKEEVERYMSDTQQRQAKMTEYVAEKAEKKEEEYGTWSLRTEGGTPQYSMQILENGEFSSMYCRVANGVRPCMWLDIS